MDFKISINSGKKLEVYDKCDTLTLFNYEKYLNTQDKLWFTNFYELKNAKKPHYKELEEAFYSFFGNLLKLTSNPRVLDRFDLLHQIMKCKTKLSSVTTILNCIANFNTQLNRELLLEHISNLEKWGYKIDLEKDLFEQLNTIANRVKGYVSEIEILEKKIQETDKETQVNLNKEIIKVATFIELKYPIDKKTTTVAQWLEYCEIATEKSINQQKNNK